MTNLPDFMVSYKVNSFFQFFSSGRIKCVSTVCYPIRLLPARPSQYQIKLVSCFPRHFKSILLLDSYIIGTYCAGCWAKDGPHLHEHCLGQTVGHRGGHARPPVICSFIKPLSILSVLGIRIRMDPDLFPEPGIFCSGSGSRQIF